MNNENVTAKSLETGSVEKYLNHQTKDVGIIVN